MCIVSLNSMLNITCGTGKTEVNSNYPGNGHDSYSVKPLMWKFETVQTRVELNLVFVVSITSFVPRLQIPAGESFQHLGHRAQGWGVGMPLVQG